MYILIFVLLKNISTEIVSVVEVKYENVPPNIVEDGLKLQLRLLLTHKVLPKWSKYHVRSVYIVEINFG